MLRAQASAMRSMEPLLEHRVSKFVLKQPDLHAAIACLVSATLAADEREERALAQQFTPLLRRNLPICLSMLADLNAVVERDPAYRECLEVFLFAKGFIALQAYRIGHRLLLDGSRYLALYLQSRSNIVLGIDINPASRIGRGIMLDHGTGIVIGETAVVEDNVSILQGVTLGGTGKETGDRHPKVRAGVMIGAGAKILGNIEIGAGAKIGANSVVLSPVAPQTTVVGVPARPVRYSPPDVRLQYRSAALVK
ncbi:serine O-acetyltransferase [Pseudomonas sp. CrR25]|nr:serine O-acetyltransferase [Pseudomonas sp. CrR25]